ncbi:hypothetical protein RRG08_007825 [Elysia crispata]|uniref:Uncharacterized protein n=1 Tax=Elysia crispata TaxID=231223 RepID=A0AAE0XX40_9GAST|nr:hypothetical protein RRG08_007825 [Elysia crispata]
MRNRAGKLTRTGCAGIEPTRRNPRVNQESVREENSLMPLTNVWELVLINGRRKCDVMAASVQACIDSEPL